MQEEHPFMESNSDETVPVGLKMLSAEKAGQGPHTFFQILV